MGQLSYGQIQAFMYLKISITDFLTLFSARTADQWFWQVCVLVKSHSTENSCIYLPTYT